MTADQYARKVESALRDLPWPQRHGLVAEIRQHLAELPAGTDFYAKLGHPERYAADLRTAAGLERRRGPVAFVRARRPRTWILTAVALGVIGLGISGVAWINSYQPLALGTRVVYPQGSTPGIGIQAMVAEFRQGKPFEVGVSVVNSGRFTVRVTGVEPWDPLPVHARLYLAGHRPFHPFDLGPGVTAFVALRGIYRARCYPVHGGGNAWGTGGFEVQYSFLWRTGRAEIALRQPLVVDNPLGEDCAAVRR